MTQPLIYSRRRRSKRLAGLMIVVVWILAGAITSPPLLGCFPRVQDAIEDEKKCSYNMDSSYVIFSAMGSFFLPMLVMLYVYGRISCVIAARHRSLEATSDGVAADYFKKRPGPNCPRSHRRSQRQTFLMVCNINHSSLRINALRPTTTKDRKHWSVIPILFLRLSSFFFIHIPMEI